MMLNSAVYFVGMSFLFIGVVILSNLYFFIPTIDFLAVTFHKPQYFMFLAIFIWIILFFLTLFLLSRTYFYLAKSITNKNAPSFSFSSIIADFFQLCMYGITLLLLFIFACIPFLVRNYFIFQQKGITKLYQYFEHYEISLLSLVLIIYIFTCFLFSSQFIMFGKLQFTQAMIRSFKIVHQNIFKSLLFSAIVLIIAFSGFLFIYIGATFTIPLAFCILSATYDDIQNSQENDLDKKIAQIGK